MIAGGFGVLTLIGTLALQVYGIRRTSRDSTKTLELQKEALAAPARD
jgi:hypothetical protein